MVLLYNLLLVFISVIGCPLVLLSLAQSKRRETMIHRLGLTIDAHVNGTASAFPAACDGESFNQKIKKSFQDRSTPSKVHKKAERPIWIHALSVGEVLSAGPIVDRLAKQIPHQPLVFSSSTMTGFTTAQRLFGPKIRLVFYFPYDFIFSVRRVVNCIDPRLMVIIETDIWPNFLNYMKKKGIPVVLTNARLSQRSFRNYRLGGRFIRQVLSCINVFGVQTFQDAIRFGQLGAPQERISVIGNVKFDQTEMTTTSLQFSKELRSVLGFDQNIRIIVAGSTHAGEEELLMKAFRQLRPQFQDLVLILAPRDPGRAPDISKMCARYGCQAGWLSALDEPAGEPDQRVLIVNAIGILRNLYAVADIAFIGGSLVPSGGHNPLEPAAWAKPIVFGPHMSDFNVIARMLNQSGAAACVGNREQLVHSLTDLLTDAHYRTAMGQKAQDVFKANKGATERTVHLITTHLS